GISRGTKWVWVSMASAKMRFLCNFDASPCAHYRAEPTMSLYKQVGLFLLSAQSKNDRAGNGNELTAPVGHIVIAGAGQAGGRAAEAWRASGFKGAIILLGEEPHPPYERPQLSKAMLQAPDTPVAYIKQSKDWRDILDVRLETGAAVTDCDAERRTVATADGR